MLMVFTHTGTIKLYGWEKPLAARLSDIRTNEELHQLSRHGLFTSLESGFGNLVPFIVAFASFASFSADRKSVV